MPEFTSSTPITKSIENYFQRKYVSLFYIHYQIKVYVYACNSSQKTFSIPA